MLGTNAGLIGGTRTASALGSGVGLWTPNEQAALRRNRSWPLSGDPFYNYNSLLLSMDGTNGSTTFTDSSSNALTVTANGNAQISTAQSKFGGASGAFDGTGDYLSVPDSPLFNLGSGNFTIEAWVRFAGYPSSSGGFYSSTIAAQDVSGSRGWVLLATGTSNSITALKLEGYSNNTTVTSANGSFSFALATWYYIAAVRSGNTAYLFVDGSLINAGGSPFDVTIQDSSSVLKIGANEFDGTYKYYLNGYIDDLRITKGVARYTANFTPPTQAHLTYGGYNDPYFPATSLLLHMDGANNSTTFTDSSLNALTVTANGDAKISTAQSKLGGASAAFDGTGDYLSLGNNSAFGFGTSDFTSEAWIYITGGQGSDRAITDFRSSSGNDTGTFFIDGSAGNKLAFWYGTKLGASGTALTTNTWHHVALSRQAGFFRCYLNGSLDWSATATVDFGSSRPLGIGASVAAGIVGNNAFTGYIDELRITKGVARYTANFTPPTAPFPDL